jgi:hypothetical protein
MHPLPRFRYFSADRGDGNLRFGKDHRHRHATVDHTDPLPADRPGRILGLCSILHMSAEATAPALFGLVLDLLPAHVE